MKEVSIYSPAYVNMEIYDDGEGAFSLDDKVGWSWYGEPDEFLLGLLRVGDSRVWSKFIKELKESEVSKNDIKTAIKKSLKKNPSDGLYHLLGDNASYLGFGIFDEWSVYADDLKHCLEGWAKDPEDVADEVIFEASLRAPSTDNVFERMEKELTEDMSTYTSKNGSWKDVVNDAVQKCDTKYKEVDKFVECVWDELLPLKEELTSEFITEYEGECYNSLKGLSDSDLKEIAKSKGVDFRKIKACVEEI